WNIGLSDFDVPRCRIGKGNRNPGITKFLPSATPAAGRLRYLPHCNGLLAAIVFTARGPGSNQFAGGADASTKGSDCDYVRIWEADRDLDIALVRPFAP